MIFQRILCLLLSAGLMAALPAYGTAQDEQPDQDSETVQEEAPDPAPEQVRSAVQYTGGAGIQGGTQVAAPAPTPRQKSDPGACSGPPLPTGRFVVSNPNGWWPKVSPDGEWVSFGARTVAVVNVRARSERKLPVEDCTYSAGWIRPGVLRAVNKCDGRSFELSPPGFTLRKTRDTPGLAIGNWVEAADGHWASNYGGRIAYDNKSLATRAGNAMDLSRNWLVFAKTNAHKEISVWKSGRHAADYPVKISMNELTVTGGYIVYGYGRIRGITPAGKDIELTSAPPGLLEGLAKVFFVGAGAEAKPWIASRIWGDEGTCYTRLRPWGEAGGIKIADCGATMSVVEHCGVVVVAVADDKGKLTIVSRPIANKAKPLPH